MAKKKVDPKDIQVGTVYDFGILNRVTGITERLRAKVIDLSYNEAVRVLQQEKYAGKIAYARNQYFTLDQIKRVKVFA